MKPARALKRYALPSVAALTVAIGLVGAMHLKAARPLLAMLGVPCPVDSTTAAQVSALRASGLAQLRASHPDAATCKRRMTDLLAAFDWAAGLR